MLFVDLLGHLAYASSMLGLFLIGKKKPIGWAFRIIGDAIWLYLGIVLSLSSIYMWEFIFITQAVYFWLYWNKDDKDK